MTDLPMTKHTPILALTLALSACQGDAVNEPNVDYESYKTHFAELQFVTLPNDLECVVSSGRYSGSAFSTSCNWEKFNREALNNE